MKRETTHLRDGSDRDPYFGRLLAQRRINDLHAEAATHRLLAEQRRMKPRPPLRSHLANGLRRLADRLAPDVCRETAGREILV